jgi:hypothetical protein
MNGATNKANSVATTASLCQMNRRTSDGTKGDRMADEISVGLNLLNILILHLST